MPELKFRFNLIKQQLEGEFDLCTSLEFNQISRLIVGAIENSGKTTADASIPKAIPKALATQLQSLIEECPSDKFHQYVLPQNIEVSSFELKINPPADVVGWSNAFLLPIKYLYWQYGQVIRVGFVPALGIHAIAVGGAKLENEVRREVRSALIRSGATRNLQELVQVARFGEIKIETFTETIVFPTAKERVQKEQGSDEQNATLKMVGRQLLPENTRASFRLGKAVSTLADRLNSEQPQSVLMVGPSGSGKTSIINQLSREKQNHGMGEFDFWQTDGSRLIAGMSGFGQWQDRCTKLVAELSKTPTVIHLGNLIELLEVGRGRSISHGIADFLRPFIVRGKILAVAECTVEQLAMIDKHSPQMLDAFHRQEVQPATKTETGEILLDIATHDYPEGRFHIEADAVSAVNWLHDRYATYSSMPGRAIRFFRNLIEDSAADSIIDGETVTKAFSDETGLPLFLLSDQKRLDLKAAQDWFGNRIIGQPEPVDLIVDLLATIKTGMNRPERPIASMLFIGPTGVGKTEMAKAVAEYMYRDPKRLVRFDMSEFNHPLACERLVGGFSGNQGLLTSKIRENPFTVLLLDEFEKAHPSVFDLLLQVLGEGRLTDGRGQLVDFSTSIVIMTSNLGVESFRESGMGFTSSQTSGYREHFIKKVQQFVRPEFFNRIDRIVPFAPLGESTTREITRRELKLFRKRDGIEQRNLSLEIDDSLIEFLAESSFDSRYGARPLKRNINRQLAWPLSKKLNAYEAGTELSVKIVAQKSGLHVQVNAVDNRERKADVTSRRNTHLQLARLSQERRRAQAIDQSPAVRRVRNELYRNQQTLKQKIKRLPGKKRATAIYSDFRLVTLQKTIDDLQKLSDRIDALVQQARQAELEAVEQYQRHEPLDARELTSAHEALNHQISHLILELFVQDSGGSATVNLYLFSRHADRLRLMARSYQQIAEDKALRSQLYLLRRSSAVDRELSLVLRPPASLEDPEPKPNVEVLSVESLDQLFEKSESDMIGLALEVTGNTSYQLFAGERGLHLFRDQGKETVLVETSGQGLSHFEVQQDIADLKPFSQHMTRRVYDQQRNIVFDEINEKKFSVEGRSWQDTISLAIETSFREKLDELIDVWN